MGKDAARVASAYCGMIMCCIPLYPTQLATDAMMLVSKTLEAGRAMSSHHTSGQEGLGQVGPLRITPEAPGESVRALRVQEVPSVGFLQSASQRLKFVTGTHMARMHGHVAVPRQKSLRAHGSS